MDNFLCFNHGDYPMTTVINRRLVKRLGNVRRVEIDCRCPVCGMEITYSYKIHKYTKGDNNGKESNQETSKKRTSDNH